MRRRRTSSQPSGRGTQGSAGPSSRRRRGRGHRGERPARTTRADLPEPGPSKRSGALGVWRGPSSRAVRPAPSRGSSRRLGTDKGPSGSRRKGALGARRLAQPVEPPERARGAGRAEPRASADSSAAPPLPSRAGASSRRPHAPAASSGPLGTWNHRRAPTTLCGGVIGGPSVRTRRLGVHLTYHGQREEEKRGISFSPFSLPQFHPVSPVVQKHPVRSPSQVPVRIIDQRILRTR